MSDGASGASPYQQSSVKFDVWPAAYTSDWSYGFHDRLRYYIK